MRLRFVEDRRTLLWAFVLFPLVPALAYAEPTLLPWLVPALLYTSYSSGVLTHNHNHCPTFVGRRANVAYGAWLSLFYGIPIFTWIPTHNQNHHRYLNGEGDATQTDLHAETDTLFALLTYPPAAAGRQMGGIWQYARLARRRPTLLRRIVVETSALVFGHLALFALAVALHGFAVGALVYGVAIAAPAALASYFMMLTNYLQHVGCDPRSSEGHSRNFTNPLFNWLLFQNGLHTVHHEHPGVHWSRYRALHDARTAKIDPALNPSTIFGYVVRTYIASPFVRVLGKIRGMAPS
jgi:beta-carotene hydroxylase